MRPWESADPSLLRSISGICLDIDDTLSTNGKLTSQAFSALWKLKEAGFVVIPITGRPAGWCDHIARFWPVDAVIGENGAFVLYMKDGVLKRFDVEPEQKGSIEALKPILLQSFPRAKWASDQRYREYDLAVDIREDVAPWSEDEVERLIRFCNEKGAHAKLSSIHVNIWFGRYDKKIGFEKGLLGGVLPSGFSLDQWLYIGDSPNDEPLFAHFLYSVGVANLRQYESRLKHPPTWITKKKSGEGFVEMADQLIRSKKL